MLAMEMQAYIENNSASQPAQILQQVTNATTTSDAISKLEIWQVILIVGLGLFIITTVIGNILILVAIATHKPLRVPQNYLIASLATSDLLVAMVVMPISLVVEISAGWIFSHAFCNFWISMDVLYCTASILNLCVISLDRYWAITKPIKYSRRRTTKRMIFYIIAVWLLSTLISTVPLFGWDNDTSDCIISQNIFYTIFSTFGAFFIPATIILVVYFQISVEARKRIRRNSRPSIPMVLLNRPSSMSMPETRPSTPQSSPNLSSYSHTQLSTPLEKQEQELLNGNQDLNSNNQNSVNTFKSKMVDKSIADQVKSELLESSKESQKLQDERLYIKKNNLRKESQDKNMSVRKSPLSACSSPRNSLGVYSSPRFSLPSPTSRRSSTFQSRGSLAFSVRGSLSSRGSISSQPRGSLSSQAIEERLKEKRALAAAREQRATRTVFIVTGTFLICWLPFFLAAIILPLCKSCHLPQVYKSIFLWLGYFNSMLNPIIYTVFNKDFKTAFKKMLCLGRSKHYNHGQTFITRSKRQSST